MQKQRVELDINGRRYSADVEPRMLLSDFIRHEAGLTGTHVGCENGVCGACTVQLEGDPVRACLMLAAQAQGARLRTVEGMAEGLPDGGLHPLQQAFHDSHGLQCGFCTPGFLMRTEALLADERQLSADEIRKALSGNLCRCTGYQNIVAALRLALGGGGDIAAPDQDPPRFVGSPVRRVEDHDLLTGAGCFVDDVVRPGQIFARVVRSRVAHARIVRVDLEAALRVQGVVAAYTAADLPDVHIPIRMLESPAAELVLQPPLAREVVRYVGEPIAVVVAVSQYVAEDAAEEVVLELEPLPVVLDPVAAAAAGATALHPELGTNTINSVRGVHGADVDELFAVADVVIRERLRVERHTAIPLETRGLVAEQDPASGRLTVWGPTKVKHFNRQALAQMLGMPKEQIRFIEPDVGGGFGVRGEFYPEDFLVPWVACRTGRPVKWTEDRTEHFIATNHAREQVCDMEIAATTDGDLLAFRARCWINQGAYARTHGGVLLPYVAVRHLGGPYRWAGFDAEAVSVMTNKTPAGTYRGPSQYEPTFFRERMLDRIAAAVELDPAELRRRNLIASHELPYRVDLGEGTAPLTYSSGDYSLALSQMMKAVDYDGLRAQVAARRRAGETVGIGIGAYLEEGGFGPWEHARAVPEPDGSFTLHVGIASLGQGVRTALGQIAADALGVDIERVRISHRDTDVVSTGFGAFASRSTILGGGAIIGAVANLELVARRAAADALHTPVDEIAVSFAEGVCTARDGKVVPLAALGCAGEHRFEKEASDFSIGVQLAVAVVDRETASAAVERLVVCHDVGRVVNPALVRGQIVGAAAQGVAGALYETLPYDEAGHPLATSFSDYLMPTAVEVPPVEAIVLELAEHGPPSSNPLGMKGCGESGIIGTGGAVANAVADALGAAGDEIVALPVRLDRLSVATRSARRRP
jgi:carbon-monoxide dehydrogenase large subunit